MTQNPTPKRNREYQSRLHDARNMERLQKALRVLADLHEQGAVPELLVALRSKEDIRTLVHKSTDGSKGGYYAVIEADDYHDKSPAARMLQSMIECTPQQRAERERLRKIGELDAAIKLTTIPGFFPTPREIVERMIEIADILPGMFVLEPSAGSGNIADQVRRRHPDAKLYCVEFNLRLRELLDLKGHTFVGSDFMEMAILPIYDRVLMNPPFEKQADIDHVRRAYAMLKPRGKLVAIMSPSWEFRSDRKATEFREWLNEIGAETEPLPDGSFKSSGTGVGTRLVIIERLD